MKIAITANNVIYDLRAIRRYVLNLIKYLPQVDNTNEYIGLCMGTGKMVYPLPDLPEYANAKYIHRKIPGRLLAKSWSFIPFPKLEMILGYSVDILHAAEGAFYPPQKKGRSIFTIHSMAGFVIPDVFDNGFCEEFKKTIRKASIRFDRFIAVSENVGKEFIEELKISPEVVKAIPLGIGEEFEPISNNTMVAKELKERFGIDGPYLLYVGAVSRHKNVEGLIDSYRILKNDKNIEHSLVIAGPYDVNYYDYLAKKISELHLTDHVKFIGYVRQECDDLPLLYNGASLFVFPTFYEAWTSPPLEAMACGTPVVTSNISSLPETVGDAALMFDPRNSEEIADVIGRILDDTSLQQNLVERGLKRSAIFTWKRMAEKTLEVYKEIYITA